MDNDKKIIIMLLTLALGVIGYSYFLTIKITDAENQISELRAAPVRIPDKKNNIPSTKFKMQSARYCLPDNLILTIAFDGKGEFEYTASGNEVVKGPYTLDKNSILLMLTKNSQQEFIINSWDNDNNVIEFSSGTQHLSTTVCKTPEQLKMDAEKAEQEKLAKEKAEQEKLEQEKLAKEKAEQEKIEQEKLAKAEQEKIAKEKAEQEKIAKEKAELEKIALEKIAKEKADLEKAAKEKAEQEKAEQEKAEIERLAKEKTNQVKAAENSIIEKLDKPIIETKEKAKDEIINITKDIPTKVDDTKLDPFNEGLEIK
jgi:hypothetical protein